MTRFTVPLLDANLVDVTVTRWMRNPGDRVEKGELVAEVTTDKAAFELECPADGTLLEVYAPLKSIVPVGYVLALVGEPGESDPEIAAHNKALLEKAARENGVASAKPAGTPAQKSTVAAAPAQAAETPAAAPTASTIRATPKARRIARENGVDLAEVAAATGATIVTEAVLSEYLSGKGQA